VNVQIHFVPEVQVFVEVGWVFFWDRMVLSDSFGSIVSPSPVLRLPSWESGSFPVMPLGSAGRGRAAALPPPDPKGTVASAADRHPSHPLTPHTHPLLPRGNPDLQYTYFFLLTFFFPLKPRLTISSWPSELFHTGLKGDLKHGCCMSISVSAGRKVETHMRRVINSNSSGVYH